MLPCLLILLFLFYEKLQKISWILPLPSFFYLNQVVDCLLHRVNVDLPFDVLLDLVVFLLGNLNFVCFEILLKVSKSLFDTTFRIILLPE
jgi:hypothetical protein